MPQGRVLPLQDRSDHRLDRRVRVTLLPRCILRVQPDQDGSQRPGENSLHDAVRVLYVHRNDVRLKNAGATYQRCMTECLKEQIGRNIHVYIDDVVVKSNRTDDLVADLTETFANLRRYKIKLNPEKCVFGVPSGQLFGFVVSKRGIEANPAKISTIQSLGPPKDLKET